MVVGRPRRRMTVPPPPWPFCIEQRQEFFLAYATMQRAECPKPDCPICDSEVTDALSLWERLHWREE